MRPLGGDCGDPALAVRLVIGVSIAWLYSNATSDLVGRFIICVSDTSGLVGRLVICVSDINGLVGDL